MPLDSLPFELLSEILDSTRDVETLHQCVLVCSTFKEAALPSLYRTITLKTVHQMVCFVRPVSGHHLRY